MQRQLPLLVNLVCFIFLTSAIHAQSFTSDAPVSRDLHIKRATDPILLDGRINETSWQEADIAKDFFQYFPVDSVIAEDQSEVRMTFDDQNLYIAVKCYSNVGNNWMINSYRRDFRGPNNDGIALVLDALGNRTNAFVFGLSPFGVRREGQISGLANTRNSFSLDWDNKWKAETHIEDGYWEGEMAIPFKTLRYEGNNRIWHFNSYRLDTQNNERSSWIRIPQNQIIFSVAYTGNLIWDDAPPRPGANISLIPFVSGVMNKNFEENEDADYSSEIGGDAKISITPSLNLDLTFNPDFSQVEVDRQVINLDRFEIFFPERRQFFLENADIFSQFGVERVRPFFSRRIGVAFNERTEINEPNAITYGARLSGSLDQDWRIGILNMQTAKDLNNDLPSINYTAAAFQRRVFARSNIGMIFINKQTFENENSFSRADTSVNFSFQPEQYHRLVGLDYTLASADNKWTGKVFYHQAMDETDPKQSFSHGGSLQYNVRDWQISWNHQWIGSGFEAPVGFVPRQGFVRANPEFTYRWYPNNRVINRHSLVIGSDWIWSNDIGLSDQQFSIGYNINFQNQATLIAQLNHDYTLLFSDFDPSGTGADTVLLEGTDYRYTSIQGTFRSDQRRVLSFDTEFYIGEFFNGQRYGVTGEATLRFQPYGTLSLRGGYNAVRLPEPYSNADLWIIGPRLDLTFTRNLFLTAFLQYNSQSENINLNTRLQWRFQPVSDLFIVYTDNYFANNLNTRSRGIVVKLTYWLNI